MGRRLVRLHGDRYDHDRHDHDRYDHNRHDNHDAAGDDNGKPADPVDDDGRNECPTTTATTAPFTPPSRSPSGGAALTRILGTSRAERSGHRTAAA